MWIRVNQILTLNINFRNYPITKNKLNMHVSHSHCAKSCLCFFWGAGGVCWGWLCERGRGCAVYIISENELRI